MTALNWTIKKFSWIFHEILIERAFKCNIYRKRRSFSPTCSTCLLPQAKYIKVKDVRNKNRLDQDNSVKNDDGKEARVALYLAILPGKPRCRVTSICPTSMPNSRAFVAATPQIFPPKKSLSILLLSCLTCQQNAKK